MRLHPQTTILSTILVLMSDRQAHNINRKAVQECSVIYDIQTLNKSIPYIRYGCSQ